MNNGKLPQLASLRKTIVHLSGRIALGAVGFLVAAGCGGSASSGVVTPEQQAATPAIATTAAQNGAVIVTLSDSTSGTTIYYTTDGTTPTNASTQYIAPFLVDSNITLKAIAAAPPGVLNSQVAIQTFSPNIASGTLVWSDEFSNSGAANARPNPSTWTYDVGTDCCGNNELETYCAWASTTGPCAPSNPSAYVGTDGYLHIVAQNPSASVYTSARLKSQGLFSFQYGRIEATIMLPESQGMWPAFWLLGNNIAINPWPACGEADVMEHIDGANPESLGYDWTQSSIHGTTLNGGVPFTTTGFSAASWHTYHQPRHRHMALRSGTNVHHPQSSRRRHLARQS